MQKSMGSGDHLTLDFDRTGNFPSTVMFTAFDLVAGANNLKKADRPYIVDQAHLEYKRRHRMDFSQILLLLMFFKYITFFA